jgi:phage terminase large subunit-like protein
MRVHAQTAWFENGFVLLPRSTAWLADYVTELTGFPGAKFDDQVDSTNLDGYAGFRVNRNYDPTFFGCDD